MPLDWVVYPWFSHPSQTNPSQPCQHLKLTVDTAQANQLRVEIGCFCDKSVLWIHWL